MCSRLCIATFATRIVLRLAQRLEQQRIRLLAALVRRHIVRALEVDRIHLVGLHELQDLHHPAVFGATFLMSSSSMTT